MTGGDVTADMVADARASLGTLRTAWTWLSAARIPGSARLAVARPTTPDRAAASLREWRLNRAGAIESARQGYTPSAPHPVPVHLAIVQTRTMIAAELVDLTGRLWWETWETRPTLHVRVGRTRRCHWCVGGYLGALRLAGPTWHGVVAVRCPRCSGADVIDAPCQACGSTTACGCDRADTLVALCLPAIAYALDHASVEPVADADETLYTLAETAEAAIGLGKDRRRLGAAECPSCGARELYAEVSSTNSREWSIHCQGPDCVCAGPGCDCGIGTPRRAGRRHRWPSITWTGPKGLAKRLGVDLPHTRPVNEAWWPATLSRDIPPAARVRARA